MKKRSLSIPVVVLIAVVALVLGSFGSATAAGITKGQVKKIAAKVVSKKASDLTVAKAATADTATTAGTAGTAGTAASAGNAANLGGAPAATYLDRVAYDVDTGSASLAASAFVELGSATLAIPAGVNFVHVTGNTSLDGANSAATIWFATDVSCDTLSGYGFDRRVQFSSTPNRDNGTIDAIQPLTGTHTFRLCARSGAASTAFGSSIVVETVALGATGGSSSLLESKSTLSSVTGE